MANRLISQADGHLVFPACPPAVFLLMKQKVLLSSENAGVTLPIPQPQARAVELALAPAAQ